MAHNKTDKDTIYVPVLAEFPEFGTTWHKLETPILGEIARDGSNVPDSLQPIVECGVRPDYTSELTTLDDEAQEALGDNGLNGIKVILADQRKTGRGIYPMCSVKESYTVHQNATLFASMITAADIVLGANGYVIASIGTLGAYAHFFMSLFIKGESKMDVSQSGLNDVWQVFACLNSSHNQTVPSALYQSATRPVCANTIKFGHDDAIDNNTYASIKHTKNSSELITAENFAQYLAKWQGQKEKMVRDIRAMQATPMSLDGFRSFAAGMFSNDRSDKLATTSFNRIEDMDTLFLRGKGNRGVSAYDALNAVTEYFTHGRGVGGAMVKESKRLASASFGRGAEWKQEALAILTNEERIKETMERGQRLYAEYAK